MKSRPTVVSIIIPVYNAEATLPVCLDALGQLDYPNLEILFIDDCSSDGSLDLLRSFAAVDRGEHVDIRVLHHEINSGVAAARNTGLDHATGMYIYYVDADDSLEADSIKAAVLKAQENDAEIVGFNWFLTFAENERKMNQPHFTSAWDGLQRMMSGTMRWNLWLFLVKRTLYEDNGIRFINGMNMGEDMMVMIKLFAAATRVAFIDRAFYHYRQSNAESLTKTYSESHMAQVMANVAEAEAFLKSSRYAERMTNEIDFLKLNVKLPLLISNKTSQYKRWYKWFPEANGFVMANKALPMRTRLIQYVAIKRQFWLLKLYHLFVVRVVYGIIYK